MRKNCNTQTCGIVLLIHNFMPKWPLRRTRHSHKNLSKNSQSNDTKQKTPDSYATGVTLYSWFFLSSRTENFSQKCSSKSLLNLSCYKPTVYKIQDGGCATCNHWKAIMRMKRKCDSSRIRDTGRWAIKITVCRKKEQNVGWDEFGTYHIKGLRPLYYTKFVVFAQISSLFFSMKTLRTIHEFCMVNLPYHNEYVYIFLMQIFTAVMGNRVDKGTPLF